MKQYILLFVCMLACLDLFPGTRSETFSLTFDKSEFTMQESSEGKQYIITEKTDYDYLGKENPGLPVRAISIALPCGYEYESFKVSASRSLLKKGVTMSGSPISFTTDTEITPEMVTEYTYGEGVYPSQLCTLTHSEEYQGMRILYFRVSPFEYRTADKSLYFISNVNLTVTMNNTPSAGAERPGVAGGLRNRDLLESILYNPEFLDSYPAPLRSSGIDPQNEHIQYLIVTNEELRESFKPLAEWKRIKGIPSKIITMEEIEAKYTDGDSPLKLKKCLYDLYQNNGLEYVLLGGDDAVVPVRYCMVTGMFTYGEIPTDLYYATFGNSFDWNENQNNIYGESEDNPGLIPSIYVTRLPVRTTEDISICINRIFEYETAPNHSNSFFFGGNFISGLHEGSSDSQLIGDRMIDELRNLWHGSFDKQFDTTTTVRDAAGNKEYNSVENLHKSFSAGYSFMEYISHGDWDRIKCSNWTSYTNLEALSIENEMHTGFSTCACNTNAFDSENGPCFSEILIRNNKSGIIFYNGCSRVSWYYPHLENGVMSLRTSPKFNLSFYKALLNSENCKNSYGKIAAVSKASLAAYIPTNTHRWIMYGLNPIGDPEMPIFIKDPQYLEKAFVICHNGRLSIDSGETGCKICISSIDDTPFYEIYEDSQVVSLNEFPKSFNVCITKDGYVPFVYKVTHMQNETIQTDNEVNSNLVKIGSAVHSSEEGPVKINSGTIYIRGTEVLIEGEFEINKGAEVIIEN